MSAELTSKEQAFVAFVLKGKRLNDAYRLAGYSCRSPKQVKQRAYELAHKPKIKAALDAGRAKLREAGEWTRSEMITTLREIAADPNTLSSARTGAIAQASKMMGYDAPQKIEAKIEGSLLHRIRNG